MAVPEKRDPNAPGSELKDLGDTREVEKSGGGWRWWWAWAVVVALAFWWAGWGWGNSGGYFWGYGAGTRNTPNAATAPAEHNAPANPANGYGNPNTSAQHASGPGVQVLSASNKQAFVGKPFQANDVQVQQKVNSRALWIGTNSAQSMLAVLKGNSNGPASANVSQGNLVNATGTVEKAPAKSQAEKEWSLSDHDASCLEQQGAYIQISQLTPPQSPQP